MHTETVQKIKLNGLDFILTTPNQADSPIATVKTYQKGECSYAHLYRSTGAVMRFRQKIGTTDDIEFGDFVEIEFDGTKCLAGMLTDNSWPL